MDPTKASPEGLSGIPPEFIAFMAIALLIFGVFMRLNSKGYFATCSPPKERDRFAWMVYSAEENGLVQVFTPDHFDQLVPLPLETTHPGFQAILNSSRSQQAKRAFPIVISRDGLVQSYPCWHREDAKANRNLQIELVS